jgi:hypothetical protein
MPVGAYSVLWLVNCLLLSYLPLTAAAVEMTVLLLLL